jgi:hypothetical protein
MTPISKGKLVFVLQLRRRFGLLAFGLLYPWVATFFDLLFLMSTSEIYPSS